MLLLRRVFFTVFSSGLLLMALFLSSCNPLYNFAEAPFAKRRVSALLEKEKVPFENIECKMMNTTRNFGCSFDADAQLMKKRFVPAMGIVQGSLENTRRRYLHTLYPQNCEKHPPFDQDLDTERFLVYENKDRQFEAIKGIEYMVLYLDTKTNKACLQASHSLG